MTQTRAIAALALGGLAALLVAGTALAHPGGRLVDRVDVLARALGISSGEVEQAREDGTLAGLLADVSRGDLRAATRTRRPRPSMPPRRPATSPRRRPTGSRR